MSNKRSFYSALSSHISALHSSIFKEENSQVIPMQVIHHTFAPLGDRRQRMTALKLSYMPWKYKRGKETELLRNALREKFQADVSLFASGREGLLALFRSIKKSSGEEVIVQGYTCVVVPNAIHAAGMTAVYCDIEKDTLNLSIEALTQAITPRTRAIICQHTFGIPGPLHELRKICDERNIFLIEDCAHVMPDDSGPSELGATGDFVMLSFGRDKAISGITGGAILSRKHEFSTLLKQEEERAKDFSFWKIMRLLEYPQIYALARPFYGLLLGRIFLWKMAKLKLLIPILTKEEKRGIADLQPHRIPNVCAALALEQLKRLQEINNHRRMLVKFYLEWFAQHGWPVLHSINGSLPLQKFPMFISGARSVRTKLKQQNIILDDGWTGCVVCPATVRIDETGYEKGLDPAAEKVCEEILSLPTHPGMRLADAEKLVHELQKLLP